MIAARGAPVRPADGAPRWARCRCRRAAKAAARTVPLQRLGREEEHAWLVALAASPLGHALSGSVITLDGARDNWFGPWPPPSLTADGGEVPTEARRPR